MSNNNSHPEECIGIINNLTTQITNLTEKQENCTIEWINMTLGITGLVLLLGMPVGYAVYKKCCGGMKIIGNDGMSDSTSINYE